MTALQLVEMIQKTMGTAFAPDVRAVATNEIQEQSLSARKARERLGWSPTYDLTDALAETVAWYRDELA